MNRQRSRLKLEKGILKKTTLKFSFNLCGSCLFL